MRLFPHTVALVALALGSAPALAAAQTGGPYDLRWNHAGAGGVSFATGGAYRLGGTAAQRTVASLSGGGYSLTAGYWWRVTGPIVGTPPGDDLPVAFAARLDGPNPFRESAALGFDLPRAVRVAIAVYGVDGRLVRQLASGAFGAGRHSVRWDGADRAGTPVPPGIYFARIVAGDARSTLRLARMP